MNWAHLIHTLPLLEGESLEEIQSLDTKSAERRRGILQVGIWRLNLEQRRSHVGEILRNIRDIRNNTIPDAEAIRARLMENYQAWKQIWWDTLEDEAWRALFDTENPQ